MRIDWRYAAAAALVGFLGGLVYRHFFDLPEEAIPINYVRSGIHATGLTLVGWFAHLSFSRWPGGRLPLVAELAIKTVMMTAALALAAAALQGVLYGEWLHRHWLVETLPSVVAISFAGSLVFASVFELSRLVGARVLLSFLLGRYHHPVREERILMFLDLAGSTRLAETLGELRVHALITRFFFEIDEAIVAHGGEVHAYVGDAVIVTWPLDERAREGRCLACFFAIEEAIARSAASWEREFGVVPAFSSGIHAGPVVASECGDTKRQIAYFGDAVNVAARLQEQAKAIGPVLVASAEVVRRLALPPGLEAASRGATRLRGREAPLETFLVRRKATSG
jgi:adenylate cyclase